MKTIAIAVVVLAVGCGAFSGEFSGPDPLLKPQPGYPCGTAGKECSDHACCGQEDVCGGDDPGCPVDSCCFAGIGESQGQSRRVHQQKRQPQSQ